MPLCAVTNLLNADACLQGMMTRFGTFLVRGRPAHAARCQIAMDTTEQDGHCRR
jgi:hypothetical protein